MTPEEHSAVESIQTLLAQIKEQTRSMTSYVVPLEALFARLTDTTSNSNCTDMKLYVLQFIFWADTKVQHTDLHDSSFA